MKTLAILALLLASCPLLTAEKVVLPEMHHTGQLQWALKAPDAETRANRLEAFWFEHLPMEEGGKNPKQDFGYEDGSHVSSIILCAWHLTRAYIDTGQKDKALEILDWLATYESKSGLAPTRKTARQEEGGPSPKAPAGE